MNFEIGEWVTGTTKQGEFVHGYVDFVNLSQGIVGIHVVASDHEAAIGKAIGVRQQGVRKLPVGSLDTEQQLMSVIDIALATRDESWFNELVAQLSALKAGAAKGDNRSDAPPSVRNRLGLYKIG